MKHPGDNRAAEPGDFPASWSDLSQPHTRIELLAFLEDAGNPKLYARPADIEFLCHFIFDDHDFFPDSDGMIGTVLIDRAEALALGDFVRQFDIALGPRSKTIKDITAAEWAPVAATATAARKRLLTHGDPNGNG